MASNYVISLEGIQKAFNRVTVLDNVDFKLKKGTIHALVGGNGAGKSTLMKILTGIYTCDSGVVKVNGEKVEIRNIDDAQKHGIKMIFQELSLSPTLTVTENIFLENELKKGIFLDMRSMNEKTQQLLNELGILADVNDKIQDLDVGICQLIEIAKALSVDSKVLVMDEPTASLTERETEILFGIMKRLKKRGVSIVYISHRMKEILNICDEISVLRDGKIVANKATSEFSMETLIECMIGSRVEKSMEYVKRETMISSEIMLRVENINIESKVRDVSFEVRKGEVLGIAGLMGSGRTEVLETLSGIRKQKEAKITLDGEVLNIKDVNYAIRKGIALVPEDRRREGLVLMHNVKENVSLPNLGKIKNNVFLNSMKTRKLTEDCIKEFNVKADNIDQLISSLSGGNQQKIVIAKWMKTDPKLLLMDEPTAGVDVGAKGEIINIIRSFVNNGKSVILVSSELTELLAVCDRIIIFREGKITGELMREEIESEERLQHAIQH